MTHREIGADWRHLVEPTTDWSWRGKRLFHKTITPLSGTDVEEHSWARRKLVQIYADQNDSRPVRKALSGVLSRLKSPAWGLNLGAGFTSLHERLINLDVRDRPNVDVVTHGLKLPFKDDSFEVVVSQEVLEHLPDPFFVVEEIHRVLKPGGVFYCQVPFTISYHPGPTDFWRFTKEGLLQLFPEPEWTVEDVDIALGHGSGFYRIAVEFLAVTASAAARSLYLPTKGLATVALAPLKLFDRLTPHPSQKDRIPGGYFCIVRKT